VPPEELPLLLLLPLLLELLELLELELELLLELELELLLTLLLSLPPPQAATRTLVNSATRMAGAFLLVNGRIVWLGIVE
jgi:hypothetical protein